MSTDLFDNKSAFAFSSSSTNALTISFIVTLSRDAKRSANRSNFGRGSKAVVTTQRELDATLTLW
ncbi:hypothetical protein DERF_001701 [Dermatophagoides farinae]|uniref:Uncharacterized protein n=1 Tax=Dermatophagoides farinae TaxID=6954 RepID=A0A922L9N5_DERFA|nr:hypothetical protein DERF_001701 [Dermatophagoides farinae]